MYNRQIKIFVTVVECGSFKHASDVLFLSTVAVMNQINALEKEVGTKLLERTNRGVIVTDAGKSLYKDAKKIIKLSEEAIQRAKEVAGITSQVIRVGTSMLRPHKVLVDIWNQIDKKEQPFQIKLVPFDDDPVSMSKMVASLGKDIDCFIGVCGSIQWMKMYNVFILGMYPCSCAVPVKHPLSKKKQLEWSDLYGETLMLVKRGDSLVIDRLRDEAEKEHPQIHIEDVPNFYDTEAFNRCEEMNYLMEVPNCWADVHPSLVTIPTNWGYEQPYGIVYSNEPSPAMQAFISCLTEAGISAL